MDQKKLKIAFDVDDVITEAPEFYSAITTSLMNNGHEVFIITDFDEYFRDQREAELKRYGISYTELVITKDKNEYCIENGISYAIDDDHSYYPDSIRSKTFLFEIKREDNKKM